MAEEIVVPRLGWTMEEGQFDHWLKENGQPVKVGEPLFVIESDKASSEIEALEDGMLHILADGPKQGDVVKVGQVIGHLLAKGESPPAATSGTSDKQRTTSASQSPGLPTKSNGDQQSPAAEGTSSAASAGAPERQAGSAVSAISPRAARLAGELGVDLSTVRGTGKQGRIREQDIRAAASAVSAPGLASASPAAPMVPVFATPSVRNLALELGVDINTVKSSATHERITEDDVKRYAQGASINDGTAAAFTALPDLTAFGPVERQPLSVLAKRVAQHMAHCWATIPHVTLHQDVDFTQVENYRSAAKAAIERQGGKLTITAILVKLVGEALKHHPIMNASYDAATQELVFRNYYHLGVAVDTPRGLVVPVMRDVDRKSLADVSKELNDTARRARDGKLSLDDMNGGTFTITNLGGIGCGHFTPIVNWPEVAILGVGTATRQVCSIHGQNVERLVVPLSLSFDHRVINGAVAARFLTWLQQAVEQPLAVLLG